MKRTPRILILSYKLIPVLDQTSPLLPQIKPFLRLILWSFSSKRSQRKRWWPSNTSCWRHLHGIAKQIGHQVRRKTSYSRSMHLLSIQSSPHRRQAWSNLPTREKMRKAIDICFSLNSNRKAVITKIITLKRQLRYQKTKLIDKKSSQKTLH